MARAQAQEKKLDRDEDGQIVLRGELFWKWKAIHEAVQRCDAEVKARTPMIDHMLESLPELKKLLGERSAFAQQAMVQRAEYNAVIKQLEDHLGFSMKNVSIDDVTGRVHRLDAEAADVPVKNGVNGHAVAKPQDTTTTQPSTPSAKKSTKKRK